MSLLILMLVDKYTGKEKNTTITNDRGYLTREAMERIVQIHKDAWEVY